MASRLTRILLFAKEPLPGRVKTRLIPALGADGAAALAETMLAHALGAALAAGIGPVELVGDPHPAQWQRPVTGIAVSVQSGADLGERMANAARKALAAGEWALTIGTDCPALSAALLREAAAALDDHDLALIPATDGGYVAIGFARFAAALFEGVRWSGPNALADTLANAARLGFRVWLGQPLSDIDDPADLVHAPPAWLAGPAR